VATSIGVTEVEKIGKQLRKVNWRKMIGKLYKWVLNFDTVDDLREEPPEDQDIVYQNAVLFLQHALVYRRFSQALKCGDSGWVEKCLAIFAIWFQNDDPSTAFPLYRAESLHLIACLKHIYSQDLADFLRHSFLINMSGTMDAFIPCDNGCEYIVREAKSVIPKSDNPQSDRFFRETLGPQLFTMKDARDHMQQESDARKHYMHSSTVDISRDVFSAARHLLRREVFVQKAGRDKATGEENPLQPSVDVLSSGIAVIAQGEIFKRYRESLTEIIDTDLGNELSELEDVPQGGPD
jgi:hypothetical protein